MKAPCRLLALVVLAVVSPHAFAGSLSWLAGPEPSLVLSLGDEPIKKTLEIPSNTGALKLTLKKFLLEEPGVVVVWKNDGEFWMSQAKKIPGAEATQKVALPPGRQITLEISTFGGTRVVSIKLLRK